MLLSLRFRPDASTWPSGPTESALTPVLAALAMRPGYLRGWVGRSPDDAGILLLAAEFDSIGNGRRALSATDLRPILWPLLPAAIDDISIFEPLAVCAPNEAPHSLVSALATDAGEFRLGTSSSVAENSPPEQ
ncbi:MAG: antibiotic biosynthesis monooxygenase [Actinobacteria bacterium]|nr:antibiotic biosynthesis monooxygenase [Actinomycetota bacterium]